MAKVLLLSLASGLVAAQQPQFIQQQDFLQQENFNTPRDPALSFNYGYEINDQDTGDAKTHQEALENGVLRGSYSVVQPDGNRRIVEYEADEVSGFQAKVRYEPGYPVQTPPQRRPSAGGVASLQGSRVSSGSPSRLSSSSGSSSRLSSSGGSSSRLSSSSGSSRLSASSGSRPSPFQGAPFPGSSQASRLSGGVSAQQQRFPARASQGQRFGPPGPTRQGAPSRFITGPSSQTSQFQGSRPSLQSSSQSSSSSFSTSVSQNGPGSTAGVSFSQDSQFRPAGFSSSSVSRPVGNLPQLSAGIVSSRRPQGVQGSRFSSGSSSQPSSVSTQNTFSSSSSQAGQSASVLSGPGPLSQGILSGSRLQAGPRPVSPGSPRPASPLSSRPGPSSVRRPVAPRPSQPNAQDVAVQIAPKGFFSQRGASSSSSSASAAQSGASLAGLSSASFGAAPQAGISGSSFSTSSQSGFSGAGFQQDRSSSSFQSGPPSVSLQSSNAFQSGQGSRFQGGPAFDQLISSSLLVTDENLDSIEAVELASAGFDDSSYAYRLVPVPVNN